jgi:uncharacterized protein YndB with AHSA1/START domain
MAAVGETAAHKPAAVLHVRRTFQAPRDRVFRAWLEPELLRSWLTGPDGSSPHAEVDARVGGEFRITMTSGAARLLTLLPGRESAYVHMVGRYLEIVPPERLVFTVGWEDLPFTRMARDASTVTVEFHERGEETEVVLTHERLPNRRARSFHSIGWRASLRNLDKLLVQAGAGSSPVAHPL